MYVLTLCVLVPLLTLLCLTIQVYQGHRFDILEGVGFIEAYLNTYFSIFPNTIWPILIELASVIYAVFALRDTLNRIKDFKRL